MYEPADIFIHVLDKGLVFKEKSLVAYDRTDGKIVAVGTEAEQASDGPQGNLLVCSPLRQGVIADYMMAVKLFTHLLHKALGKTPFRRPAVAVCVPKGISEVETRAMEDVLRQSGAREVMMTDVPVEQLARERSSAAPHHKFRILIGITKDEPERYIKERLSETLDYAAQTGCSPARVTELLSALIG